jgi:hypothetical protein
MSKTEVSALGSPLEKPSVVSVYLDPEMLTISDDLKDVDNRSLKAIRSWLDNRQLTKIGQIRRIWVRKAVLICESL